MLKTMKTLEMIFSALLIVLMLLYIFFELTNPMLYVTITLGCMLFSSGGIKVAEGNRVRGGLTMLVASLLAILSLIQIFS